MEAAALALAEAALEEAAARERHAIEQASAPMPAAMDTSVLSGGSNVENMDWLQASNQIQAQEVDLLQNLMSLPDENARNQFLQMLSFANACCRNACKGGSGNSFGLPAQSLVAPTPGMNILCWVAAESS